ncbi:MAG: hypothetical protein MUD10_01615 [Candidatus Pacebacteria bacterium]|nr:hypothetical protein [Candidatus Paceibacterota bacterium]
MENDNKIYVDWIDRVKILQKAVVMDKEGRILALKRTADSNRSRPNYWDLSGGFPKRKVFLSWRSAMFATRPMGKNRV